MKAVTFALAVYAALLTPAVFGQDDQPIPVPPGTQVHEIPFHPTPTQPATAGLTIPHWSYSVVSPVDGKTYTGQIIGVHPATRPAQATVIPTVVVPVRLIFKYSSGASFIFDPTVSDPGCLGGGGRTALSLTEESPLINDANFVFGGTNVGTTQYTDAFQRANFWSDVSASGGSTYHTLLGFAPMPVQSVTVPSANSGTPKGTVFFFSGQCGTNTGNVNAPGSLGVMDIAFFDPVARSLITKLGITPNSFVIFLLYNAVMSHGNPTIFPGDCCIGGFHSAVGSQTYGVAEFEGRAQLGLGPDTIALSHEIGEWMNDPLANNLTPSWGHIGQVSGCYGFYEVGDPLSGTLMPTVQMPNGFTYHLQELAFAWWFYRLSPSGGIHGWYSNNGTFLSGAGPVCQ